MKNFFSSQTRGFTLAEVLVASSLSLIIMVIFLSLSVKSMELWRDGLARLQLSETSRIVRERALHGLNGLYGLRQAGRARLVYGSNWVDFSDAFSSNALALYFNPGQPPVGVEGAAGYRLGRGPVAVEYAAITSAGQVLQIDLALSLTNGPVRRTQAQRIRVYLLNE